MLSKLIGYGNSINKINYKYLKKQLSMIDMKHTKMLWLAPVIICLKYVPFAMMLVHLNLKNMKMILKI